MELAPHCSMKSEPPDPDSFGAVWHQPYISLSDPSTRNSMASAFRKIDIDAYDEDALHESELYEADARDPAQVLDEARQRQAAVRSSLAKYAQGNLIYDFNT